MPGYIRLLDALEAEAGPAVRADLAAAFDAATADGDVLADGAVDELDAALLLGARNRAQLYELSERAETTRLASRATVSARKRRLESAGLLDTEKVTADVGRPRQRLVLADGPPATAGVAAILGAARSVLADDA